MTPSRLSAAPKPYEILNGSLAEFRIHDYANRPAFASFLPGIAGPFGIPLWCYYVNRGQGVASFGVENKDGAILEFEPANKAYRLVPLTGFRSFLLVGRNKTFYEPFQNGRQAKEMNCSTSMTVSPWDLRLVEENFDLSLRISVRYFTLANHPLGALCRELSVESLGSDDCPVQILDGLPMIAPFGLGDQARKNMGRTMEAWSFAEGLDQGLPYFRQRSSSKDSVEINEVHEGHFFFARLENGKSAVPVVDPARVFGPEGDLAWPRAFVEGKMDLKGQRVENRSPSAFSLAVDNLKPESPLRLRSVFGRAANLQMVRELDSEMAVEGVFEAWDDANRAAVLAVAGRGWVASGEPALDGYALQTHLDNVLRGGQPVSLEDGPRRATLHLYSRKHGDLERDYNDFQLSPSPFSQGNGAFRDICQNRRNDHWTSPELGDQNLRYFANLLQLDGHNPLQVQGLEYRWQGSKEGREGLARLLGKSATAALLAILERPFTPRDLHRFFQSRGLSDTAVLGGLYSLVLTRSRATEKAEPDHGYWIDHGFYLTDLLERYEAMYPDKVADLLQAQECTWYHNALQVQPRSKKVKPKAKGWRQYGAVAVDREVQKRIESRRDRPYVVRDSNGDFATTSLWAKLLCLAANKLASLDPQGLGVEMDADKPDWNDAVNGLPGLFGSSTNESQELMRLLKHLKRWADQVGQTPVPEELAAFVLELSKAPRDPLAFWSKAGALKESYRAAVRLELSGDSRVMDRAELTEFLDAAILRVKDGLKRARREDGLMNTYYYQEPKSDPSRRKVSGFKATALPLFLEGQVHALRLARPERAKELSDAVEASALFDSPLGMFLVNESLQGTPEEIGRLRAFTPGWLENQSVFMHMEFKYLLELLKAGLFDDFYRHFRKACPAFLDPQVYGRSPFENCSFIASSANPDEAVHGRGYVARLSGTTCEFVEILLTAVFGRRPFAMVEGSLVFRPHPALASWMFRKDEAELVWPAPSKDRRVSLKPGDFAMACFGGTLVVVHGHPAEDHFGKAVESIEVTDSMGRQRFGDSLPEAQARRLRAGEFERLDLYL